MNASPGSPDLGEPIAEGRWAGWRKWTVDDPFEEHIGPFYSRRDENGKMICGTWVEPKNQRIGGIGHGGFLMSFADYALFLIAYDELGGQDGVTVSMNHEFLAAAPADVLLIARGEVLRKGASLMFVRGVISAGETDVLAFSGVVKILRAR